MSALYSKEARALQDEHDTRRLADRLAEVKVHARLTEDDRAFIARMDMFFLATVDASGQPTCSYKGGDPGFVTVVDDVTLAFPNYDGNGMYLSMGNIDAAGQVGMLFIDFERGRRMRVDGRATRYDEDALMSHYPGAQFIVRVQAERIFPNCPRYIHRMQLVERSEFVPHDGVAPPVPAWKQAEWARDVLPNA